MGGGDARASCLHRAHISVSPLSSVRSTFRPAFTMPVKRQDMYVFNGEDQGENEQNPHYLAEIPFEVNASLTSSRTDM